MGQVLRGKTALVTGASRGIGRAIACRLAKSGALVAVNYATNEAAARETVRLIEAAGGSAFPIQAMLGPPEVADVMAKAIEDEFTNRAGAPGLDILVNNAGSSAYGRLAETEPETYNRILSDNVGSTFFTTKAVLPLLRKDGRVINISSAGARLALEDLIIYCMSKGAVEVFTRALAKDLGARGVTVNAVCPGYIATDGAASAVEDGELVKQIEAMSALGKAFGEPEDIAEVVHALATPAMGWVTGQIIEVSGGFRM